jgi:rod shape-determining protein MreC
MRPSFYYGAEGAQRLSEVPQKMRHLLEADTENGELRQQLKEDQWMSPQIKSLQIENERLRRQLELKPPAGWAPIWARVIERDPSRWYSVLMIDAGKDQGVALDGPVLGEASGGRLALVGRITEVRQDSAVVLLGTDGLSSAASYFVSSSSAASDDSQSEMGLVQGQDGPLLKMNYISPESSLGVGDQVYTSAISAVFPPDISVGVVERIDPPDPFLTFRSAQVRPTVSASALREVLVLKSQRPVRAEDKDEDEQP